MDHKQNMRSDTKLSTIVEYLQERHGAVHCSWRFYKHSYTVCNEIINRDKDMTLASVFENAGQPNPQSAPEFELWYNYETTKSYKKDPLLLAWCST